MGSPRLPLAGLLWCTLFGTGACDTRREPPGPDAGAIVDYTPPAVFDPATAKLPRLPNGNTVLLALPGLRLEHNATRKDPLTALADCTQWVFGCFDPATRSLDACVNSVPSCKTAEPWAEAERCCPAACKTQYAALRQSGSEPYPALDKTLFEDGSCAPGVNALLGRP